MDCLVAFPIFQRWNIPFNAQSCCENTDVVQCENDKITGIRVQNRDLSGPIPTQLAGLKSLREIYLSKNGLTGQIPDIFQNLTQLTNLSLNDNSLSGPLPVSLSKAPLVSLHIQNNRINGSIPQEYSRLVELVEINISGNNITGALPASWQELKISSVCFGSCCNLGKTVCMPIGTVAPESCGSVQICPQLAVPTPTQIAQPSQQQSPSMVIPIVVGIVGLLVLICLLVFCYTRHRHKDTIREERKLATENYILSQLPSLFPKIEEQTLSNHHATVVEAPVDIQSYRGSVVGSDTSSFALFRAISGRTSLRKSKSSTPVKEKTIKRTLTQPTFAEPFGEFSDEILSISSLEDYKRQETLDDTILDSRLH
ncbi:hypothetical protein EDD86DRAFT_212710 [Gorgonomyces haynaldii]|nr:hypothetical protein EDD86DRAFT_212710 [Gorgonomyces haynaldii]